MAPPHRLQSGEAASLEQGGGKGPLVCVSHDAAVLSFQAGAAAGVLESRRHSAIRAMLQQRRCLPAPFANSRLPLPPPTAGGEDDDSWLRPELDLTRLKLDSNVEVRSEGEWW